ncbi:MAG: response regulator [Oscillospiraceae bacterium]|nr:response regulator [Oscillospiraceae bacterium]
MNIIAVDDEYLPLIDLEFAIKEAAPEASVQCFESSLAAAEFGNENHIDIAYLDINMPGLSGIDLAKKLRETNPGINIIFATGHDEYARDAFSLKASDYLTKPISADAVKESLLHLRTPVEETPDIKLKVQCFGNFDVFTEDGIIYFQRQKAKELLAYLIHKRGTSCTIKEICAVIFERSENPASLERQLQTQISLMMKTLKEAGAEDVIIKNRNNISIDVKKVDCDYYRFLENDEAAKNLYMGEYMTNYEWAEFKTEYLDGALR